MSESRQVIIFFMLSAIVLLQVPYHELAGNNGAVVSEAPKRVPTLEKIWVGRCDEHARVNFIKNCLTNYYGINPVKEANVSDEQEAFERCRAAASYQFCKWREE